MPASAEVGPRPRTCMDEAGGRGAFTCMHVRGQGPAEAEAGVIGRNKPSQACFVQGRSCQGFTKGKREDMPLMHTA
eukprot:255668-Chlamydomonas_euryale.AAC.3